MTTELYWLTLTVLMTAIFWMPYIVNRIFEIGLIKAAFSYALEPEPKALWAKRMASAHANAVENLVIFAPLVLVVHLAGLSSELTATAVMAYFYARLAHFLVYTFGIPGLRTITFFAGFACQMILALTILGLV